MTQPPEPDPAPAPSPGAVPGAVPAPVTLTPVETDTGRIVHVGTAVFAAAFVVLLVLRFAAPDWTRDHPDWVWIAFAGTVLGLIGSTIVGRHRRLGRTR